MRLTGTVRPTATSEIVAAGHDRSSAYEALTAQVPEGFESEADADRRARR